MKSTNTNVQILRFVERRVDRRRWHIFSILRKDTPTGPQIVSRPVRNGEYPVEFENRDEARIYRMQLQEDLKFRTLSGK